MRRRALAVVVGLMGVGSRATPAAAQLPNQAFEVMPQVAHATVGDSVPLRFRVRLDQVDLLYDSVPQPSALPDGVRLLAVEKLQRQPDRSYTGRAVVAFFRVGRQAVPVFALPFMRGVKGLTRGTLTSDSTFVEIDPVVPPGNPPLKDIRDIVRQRARDWWPIVGAGVFVALVALGVLLGRRRRHRTVPESRPEPAAPTVAPRSAYDSALARLAEIERAKWAADGDVARHYAAVADTLRRYLDEAHVVPALTYTTSELARALEPSPAHAALNQGSLALLEQADLVKFARVRPDGHAADRLIQDARALLAQWHSAVG